MKTQKSQKSLAIVALTVVVLVFAYFLYDHFRPHCDSIFEQTSTRLGGNLEVIRAKGEVFVGREKLQELSDGSQKVALHLKACCVAQQSGILTPEQFQGCMNGAKDYESKVLQVSSIIGEAQVAKDQGNLQLVDQRAAQAREVVGAASETVSQLGKVAATITSAPKSGSSTSQPNGPLATEKHRFFLYNYSGTAITISFNGRWVGQWDNNAGWIPLESVVQGKNAFTVEFESQPQNTVRLSVEAQRGDDWVSLLDSNFQGKAAGKYTVPFVAR
jgi:hypothetical protein